ncbi:MAG: DNA-binding domain-containing protein [Burkholderiales bacterium]
MSGHGLPNSNFQGLLQVQLAFQDHLLHGSQEIAGAVRPGRGLDIAGRLAIYHHAYRARLVDAVREGHEHTASWLGAQAFDELAGEFVEHHPSRHPNLRWYAQGFAPWLQTRRPDDRVLAELATLDWALRCAFDGPDAPVLGLADLARVSADEWSRVGFELQPTAARRVFRWNALAIWHALDEDLAPPLERKLEQPVDGLIWRRDLQPHFRSLQPFEAAALNLIGSGIGFGAACEELAARFPEGDAAREVGALLRRWIDDGLLSALTV